MNISVIILTYNEEIHIERCIERVKPIAQEILVVDSFSTDRTVEIAERLGATVVQNRWPGNQAAQFNWALDNCPISGDWVLRLDADEYLTEELKSEIEEKIPLLDSHISGITFLLKRVFLGRTIRRGMPPIRMIRFFRYGKARCEVRNMDEHIQLYVGNCIDFENAFVDHNLNNLSWWSQKHIGYAIREAADLLSMVYGPESEGKSGVLSKQAAAKRLKKLKYAKAPLFWRSFFYFCYRYFFKLGFLEGREGFLWHFLQGWWYRTLVDAKVMEIERACGGDWEKMKKVLREDGVMF